MEAKECFEVKYVVDIILQAKGSFVLIGSQDSLRVYLVDTNIVVR
jgi:hypothetical protein